MQLYIPIMKRILKTLFWFVILTIIAPLSASAVRNISQGWPSNWRVANWNSSGLLPQASSVADAQVIVLATKTGQWKSIFAEHMSIVLKRKSDQEWTRYDVVGWDQPVRKNNYVADAYWYGNAPRVIYKLQGDEAEALIPKIESSIAVYPNSTKGSYVLWPGPNSNTFVAWVVRHTEGFNATLSPLAVGKDFLGRGFQMAEAPSKTGYSFSWNGYLGLTLAKQEGLELHLIGGTIGIDPMHLGIKLPGLGQLGLNYS